MAFAGAIDEIERDRSTGAQDDRARLVAVAVKRDGVGGRRDRLGGCGGGKTESGCCQETGCGHEHLLCPVACILAGKGGRRMKKAATLSRRRLGFAVSAISWPGGRASAR